MGNVEHLFPCSSKKKSEYILYIQYQPYRIDLNIEVITEIINWSLQSSSSSIDMMGQRTLTWTVQPAYWKEQKPQLIFPLLWKFTPSGINSCFISYSFAKDSLPTTTCKGPISHRFKHYYGILVPYCLQKIWAICRKFSYCFPPPPVLQQAATAQNQCI